MTADDHEYDRRAFVPPRRAHRFRAGSLRGIMCVAMLFWGVTLMIGGTLARDRALRTPLPMPVVSGVPQQQTLRTVSEVTVVLGSLLLLLGMVTGAKLLARPADKRRRTRVPRPPASERSFSDRLSQYLEEQPAPAVRISSNASRSFFLAMLPGPRRGPKSPGVIREILMRIHMLLRGEK